MAQSTTTNTPPAPLSLPDKEKVQASLIGQPCGQHSSYTFYKAFSYLDRTTKTKRILMLGEFFFLRISPHDDPCIGELQLLWEDRQRNQLLSSTRLYFLPEQTPGGRQSHHGQHEVLAASDKVILRLTDLVSWITHQVDWIAGLSYQWPLAELPSDTSSSRADSELDASAVAVSSPRAFAHNQNVMPSNSATFLTHQRFINDRCRIRLSTSAPDDASSSSPCNRGLDFSDVINEKLRANELKSDLSNVVVLSYTRYCRYRSLLKRIEGSESELHRVAVVQQVLTEIGIPIKRSSRVNIHFCRDTFEHEALLSHDLNCDHLAPRLKGRPRKRLSKHKSNVRASSPESISSEDNSRAVQPRRSQRSAVASILTDSTINYSETKNLRRTKQRRTFEKGNKAQIDEKTNKSANKENKSDLCNNTSGGSGNDTDNSSRSSSVDSNNNAFVANNVNHKLKEDCVRNELLFLQQLNKFMKERKTPIHRVPNLGFKKIDLFVFFTHASKFGGYNNITIKRFWKKLYDQMGGDKRSTSAATITRRHYERLLLPFERYLNGLPDNLHTKKSKTGSASTTSTTSKEEEDGDEDEEIDNYEMDEEQSNDTSEYVDKSGSKALVEPENKSDEDQYLNNVDEPTTKDDSLAEEKNQLNDDNDNEELILKYSNSQINKIKQSKMSDSFDGQMLVGLAKEQSLLEVEKNILTDDVKLIASFNNELPKEDKTFVNIIKDNMALYDNEDVKIQLPVSDLHDQESKFIDKIGQSKIEIGNKETKQDSFTQEDSCTSVTIVPTSTSIHKSHQLIDTSSKPGCFQNVPFKFTNLNYHNKMTALVHPTQRETKSGDIYDFDDFSPNDIDKQKTSINEILLLKSNKSSDNLNNNKSTLTASPISSVSTLVSKMPETDLLPQSQLIENVVKENIPQEGISSKPEISPTVARNLNVSNSFVYKAFSMPKPLESPNHILLSLKQKQHKDKTLRPLPAHYRGSKNEFYNKSLSANLNSDIKGGVLDLSVKKRSLEIPNQPQLQIAYSNTFVPSNEGFLLDLSVNKKRLNSANLKVNSKKPLTDKAMLQSTGNFFQNSNHNYGHNQTSRSTSNTQIESIKNALLAQASSQIPPGINQSKYLVQGDSSRKQNKFSSTKQFKRTPNFVDIQHRPNKVNEKIPKQGAKQHVLSSNLQQHSAPSALNHQKASSSSSSRASSRMADRISISEYNPALPPFIGSPSFYPNNWPSNDPSHSMSNVSFPNAITSASNVHNNNAANTANASALPTSSSNSSHFTFSDLLQQQQQQQQNDSLTNNSNASINQALLNQVQLMESLRTSPLFLKSLFEQNQAGANVQQNAINYLALAQHLFASSSK